MRNDTFIEYYSLNVDKYNILDNNNESYNID